MATDDLRTSATLLRQLADLRNEEAWRRFLGRYGPLITAWCRGRGLEPDEADEVAARVLDRLVQAMGSYVYDPGKGRFRDWLRAVVENQVTDYWRRLRRRPGARGSGDTDVHELLEQQPDPASLDELAGELDGRFQHDLAVASRLVADVQARVEPRTWQAFWLTAVEGRSAREAAAALALSVTAVSQAKYRLGRMLRQAWQTLAEPAAP
jgi:RNA polymerase sigma-70 factor (ECF subfamily)